jgi:nuclear pore complex protein Nup93
VAACDVNDDHTEVAQSTDDYLWIKLCQLKEDELAGHDSSHERVTYSQFQSLVLEEYGILIYLLTTSIRYLIF